MNSLSHPSAGAADQENCPTSAYIHVPFCLHRCGYCDFTVIAGRDDLIPAYLEGMQHELRLQLGRPRPMQTLFIGGGTPTYLPAADLRKLLKLLREWLPLVPGGEFSIECNPERLTSDRMDELRSAGVNRISLGVQSFHSSHLQTLERSHTADTVKDVVERLRERGLMNISLDLIFGVPGQTLPDWKQSLDQAVSLKPQHLSAYGLTFEKGTAFWGRREKDLIKPVPEELERDMYELVMTRLAQAGFQQYELSNYARPQAECRHNQVYWRGESYYGIGPGAAGFHQGTRRLNHRSVTMWLKRILRGESTVQEEELLDTDLQRREAIMLGLRQVSGISRDDYRKRHGLQIIDLAPEALAKCLANGWLEETETHTRLTWEGRFVADTVMSEFF